MKKFMIALLVGMLMCPMVMQAKVYIVKHGNENPNPRPRSLDQNVINVSVNYWTGDLYVSSNNNITDMCITITQNGICFDVAYLSLLAGQTYTTSLASYNLGEYLLTIENSSNQVVDQYIITITDN